MIFGPAGLPWGDPDLKFPSLPPSIWNIVSAAAAMVAPTPVSALLHAVAVVKAGVFAILKITVYIFGLDLLSDSGVTEWLLWVAAFTIVAASLVALRCDNLKARLA